MMFLKEKGMFKKMNTPLKQQKLHLKPPKMKKKVRKIVK
jgi:hypothetical protein